ncbi:MAG: Uncharacterised protein [Polaribacter sejongensis]|nr:MAG: Uncharacterised protein [Polaribacter sejongensis]
MKKITLLITLLTISFGFAQDLPYDFETSPVTADFEGFDGGVATVEAVGTAQAIGNTSVNLLKIVKGAGQVWAGAKIILDTPFDFSTKSNIEVRIFTTSPIGSKIEFKAEQNITAGATSGPKLAYTTKTGEWETLTFDFSGVTDTNLTALVMIPYLPGDVQGDGSEASTFYFDDIAQSETTPVVETCSDGIKNQDETGVDCGGVCNACPEISLPLDFSDASQLFTYDAAGHTGGSVALEGGKLRFNGNGHAYDQAYLDLTTPFSLIDNANNTFTVTMDPIDVPAGEERTHLIKASFAGGSAAGTQIEGKSIGSGEQEVTFNFGASGAEPWTQIVIFMDFGTDGANTINGKATDYLISSITLGADPASPPPPVASPPTTAPTAPPTRNAGDVISFYSEAYTSTGLNGVTWDNGADAVEENIASNNLLKITNGTGDFIGNEVANTDGFVNATDMTHLHADFWIGGDYVAGQVLKVKLSNHTGGSGETNSITKEIATLSTDAQNWVSIDLELGDDARERIAQVLLIYTNSGAAPSTVYTDNIYMYRAAATAGVSDNAALNVAMHPNPAAGVLNLSAANTIEDAIIYNVLGREVMGLNIDSNSAAIDVSGLSSGIYLIKYTVGNAVGTAKFIKE